MNKGKKRMKLNTTMVEVGSVELIDDMVLEILVRLPANSIVRFKCVCKQWLSVITDHHFLPRHLPLQIPRISNLLLVHFFTFGPFAFEHIQFIYLPNDQLQLPMIRKFPRHPSYIMFPGDHPPHCHLVDSCKGLLLLRFREKAESYYIFNPFTRHCLKLPSTNPDPVLVPGEKQIEATTYIIFDPSLSLSYKVIRWLKYEIAGSGKMHCQLHSSQTGSWKYLIVSFPIDVRFSFDSRPTLLKGVLYWSYWCTPLDVSYCFEIEKESVSSLALPPKPSGFDFRLCLYFGECGGRLVLIEKYLKKFDLVDHLPLPCTFDVMEMMQSVTPGLLQFMGS